MNKEKRTTTEKEQLALKTGAGEREVGFRETCGMTAYWLLSNRGQDKVPMAL